MSGKKIVYASVVIVNGSCDVDLFETGLEAAAEAWKFCSEFWEREVGTDLPRPEGIEQMNERIQEYLNAVWEAGKSEQIHVVAVDATSITKANQ